MTRRYPDRWDELAESLSTKFATECGLYFYAEHPGPAGAWSPPGMGADSTWSLP